MQWQPNDTLRPTPRGAAPTVRPLSPPVTRPLREVMFGWVSLTSSHAADSPNESCEPVSAPAEPPGEMDALDEL